MPSPKDGSTQALQRQPRVLRYAIALQVHTPEKHGRFGLARRFRLLQVNMFRVKLVLEQTPPVAIKTESARALATPKRGEFIGPPLPKGVGIPAHQMQHMHHDHVRFDVAPSSLEAFEVRVIMKFLGVSQTRSRHSNCQRALQAFENMMDSLVVQQYWGQDPWWWMPKTVKWVTHPAFTWKVQRPLEHFGAF